MNDYSPAVIDPLLADMAGALDENVKAADHFEKEATTAKQQLAELQKEIATLKSASPAPAVVLEKVASKATLSPEKIASVVQMLRNRQLVPDEEAATKIATRLRDDPDFSLDLINRIASFQDPPSAQPGGGIERAKSAAVKQASDPDGWGIVLTQGA